MTCVKIYLRIPRYNPIIIIITVLLFLKFQKKMLLLYWKNLYCYIYVFEATHLPKMLKKLSKKSKKSKERSLRATIKKASVHSDYGH